MNHREIFDTKIEEIFSSTEKYFTDIEDYAESIDVEQIKNLSDIKPILDKLRSNDNTIKSINVTFKLDSIKMIIDKEFGSKLDSIEFERNNTMLALRNKIEKAMELKRNEIRAKNDEIRSRNEQLKSEINEANSKYRQLEVKRLRLLEYSQEILQLCSDYSIKVSDININNDMFTIEELDLFYDQFYTFISNSVNKRVNPISWIRDKLNHDTNALTVAFIVMIIIAYSPVMDLASIALLLYIIYNQSIQESLVKRYTIMAGLAFNINPMELGVIKEITEDMIEQEISEDIDIDNEPEFEYLLQEVNESMENISDEDIRNDMSKVIASYTKDYAGMETELNDVITAVGDRKEQLLNENAVLRNNLIEKEKELKSQVKLLGTEFEESGVLNTEVKLGINKDTLIYETVDLGMQNIIFKQKGNSQAELDKFIKVLITNYLCNVRPGFFDITVFDPNNQGRSLAGFYNEDLEQIFNIADGNLEQVLDGFREHTDKVIKTTRGKNINEYNEEVSKDGRICLDYKLLIILSQPKTLEENEALRSFIEYSANLGVFVWMVSDNELPNTKIFNKPFEGIANPIDIDPFDFPIEVMDNMAKAFESLKSPSLMWNEFIDRAIPEEDIWTYNGDEFIELDAGFEDGDPSKFKPYTLGHTGDVHALGVGGTGAGKSVFINNLIANVTTKYHPNSIELWLADFKGTEFNFYLKRPDIGQPYMLPHIAACLCTSDPDYSVSLFGALREKADARYKFLKEEGFKDMYSFNKAMRKQGREDRCLKRILFIADEFQVIFEKTEAKAQEILKGHITQIAKVARACGVHFLFFSQSMKGTVSDDILSQFTLRFALRCPMEVSLAIMGTKYAGDIREKNGYLYVSSSNDKKAELQKRYRTPFIPDDQLRARISLLAEKAIKENVNVKEAISYDEADKHMLEEIDEIYNTILKDEQTEGLFILGERMVYSEKGSRSNIFLPRENNQHIFSVFSNPVDYVMYFKTLMKNLEYDSGYQLILNSQVPDMGYLCGMDKYINERNAFFAMEEQTPAALLKPLQDVAKFRMEKNDIENLEPQYIILIGWDKALGFGIDSNFKITDQYATLMQTCGVLNMHFIFICTSQGDIPKSIIMSSHHKIAGKCDVKSSNSLLDSEAAYKIYDMPDGYMFLNSYNNVERLKIYQSKIDREIKKRELSI